MSFSWSITGAGGVDLLKKYNIHYQALGLAPNTRADTDAPNRLDDIRHIFSQFPFKEGHPPAAQTAVEAVKIMLRENLASLEKHHCDTCKCPPTVPTWDVDQINRFLSIPVDEVEKASGGS